MEFEVVVDPDGRSWTAHVTGLDGAYIQGAPRRMDTAKSGFQLMSLHTLT